jgi:hypothetical protein
MEDRIPVRNAKILAYIATLMLRTLKPLREDLIAAGLQRRADVLPSAPTHPKQDPAEEGDDEDQREDDDNIEDYDASRNEEAQART